MVWVSQNWGQSQSHMDLLGVNWAPAIKNTGKPVDVVKVKKKTASLKFITHGFPGFWQASKGATIESMKGVGHAISFDHFFFEF